MNRGIVGRVAAAAVVVVWGGLLTEDTSGNCPIGNFCVLSAVAKLHSPDSGLNTSRTLPPEPL